MLKKQYYNVCLICNKGSYRSYTSIGGRSLIKCDYCGVIRLAIFPDKKQINKIISTVETTFFREYEAESESYLKYFNEKIHDIKMFSKDMNILDVGCSTGIFLKGIRMGGYKGEGYDCSKTAVNICRGKGLSVSYRNVDALKSNNKKFGIITAFQLIEHLTKPDAFIKWVNKSLKRDGLLIITTPDVNGLISKISGKKWFGYRNLEHFYFFTFKSLTTLLVNNGFEVVYQKCEQGRILNIKYISERLKNYYYFDSTVLKYLIGIINKLLFFIDNINILHEPFVNIYLIAKKKNIT